MKKDKIYKAPHISDFVQAICTQYNLDFMQVKAFLIVNFPELKDKEVCANCGESMKSYWHNISPGLVAGLIKAIEFVSRNNRNYFHLAQDLNLSKTEYNNFQKLRFHALVAHVDGKPGYWLITKRGGQFLRGETTIPKSVKTFRNRVMDHSEELVHIENYKHHFPEFQSEFAYEVQQGKLL